MAKISVTEHGLTAIQKCDTEMSSLETRVLIMCVAQERTELELVELIRHHDSAYRFLHPKFVAQAVSALVKRGYARYPLELQAAPRRLSRKERRAYRGA